MSFEDVQVEVSLRAEATEVRVAGLAAVVRALQPEPRRAVFGVAWWPEPACLDGMQCLLSLPRTCQSRPCPSTATGGIDHRRLWVGTNIRHTSQRQAINSSMSVLHSARFDVTDEEQQQ
eukprot:CAMPEP_0179131958 /NCGR_PEP_ID=MMETSP0796-20121207/62701_1 /TAXON_ID=73915 /ORGANISM="Pyrodinium bahamense, Strain pbaha01" /LENGTH=118 /DNA_ID=CAMNT_0020830891 /DNA_START=762 /DNA_END=1115 /DNA_ORIENTATION=-